MFIFRETTLHNLSPLHHVAEILLRDVAQERGSQNELERNRVEPLETWMDFRKGFGGWILLIGAFLQREKH